MQENSQQSQCYPWHTRRRTHRPDDGLHSRHHSHHIVSCSLHDAQHSIANESTSDSHTCEQQRRGRHRATVQVHHPLPHHKRCSIESGGPLYEHGRRSIHQIVVCAYEPRANRHHDHEEEQPPHDEPEHCRQTKHAHTRLIVIHVRCMPGVRSRQHGATGIIHQRRVREMRSTFCDAFHVAIGTRCTLSRRRHAHANAGAIESNHR